MSAGGVSLVGGGSLAPPLALLIPLLLTKTAYAFL
jgi:hypothetical protein